jgi:hypothetical protein
MLTVAEFYALSGEIPPTGSDGLQEQNFARLQISVGEEAIRNYTRRYISPMVWEDRFQRPNVLNMHETPIIYVDRVIADGVLLSPEAYYFDMTSSRLFSRALSTPFGWPFGMSYWLADFTTPAELPQYYGNWRGVGSLIVIYKAGYSPVPMVIKQVIADYVYERVQLRRAIISSGGTTPIPTGSIQQIAIEGVGSIRYADGGTTTASSSYRAQRSGEPVIGAAGPLLDAFVDVAVAVPGIAGLISHRKAVLQTTGNAPVLWSSDPIDKMIYSPLPNDLVTYGLAGAPGVVVVQTNNPQTVNLWQGVAWGPFDFWNVP